VIIAILQARLSSTRLPGKVLAALLDEPMIMRQVERLRHSALIDRLVVATSSHPSDDALADLLHSRGVEVRRGSLDDVVGRFGAIVDEFSPDVVVRLTGDCPLADPEVIDRVIQSHIDSGRDYSSNTLSPTYPDGLDVEAIDIAAWRRLVATDLTAREREHVTLGLYGRPEEFTLHSVTQDEDHSALRWTVDVADDLEFVRAVYKRLYYENPGFGQADVLALLREHPELNRTESDLARNAGLASE